MFRTKFLFFFFFCFFSSLLKIQTDKIVLRVCIFIVMSSARLDKRHSVINASIASIFHSLIPRIQSKLEIENNLCNLFWCYWWWEDMNSVFLCTQTHTLPHPICLRFILTSFVRFRLLTSIHTKQHEIRILFWHIYRSIR